MSQTFLFRLAFVPALLVFVLVNLQTPQFADMFKSFGAELPIISQFYFRWFRALALVPFAFVLVWFAWPRAPQRGAWAMAVAVTLSCVVFGFAIWAVHAPLQTLCEKVC